jgi:hypothetical protein
MREKKNRKHITSSPSCQGVGDQSNIYQQIRSAAGRHTRQAAAGGQLAGSLPGGNLNTGDKSPVSARRSPFKESIIVMT